MSITSQVSNKLSSSPNNKNRLTKTPKEKRKSNKPEKETTPVISTQWYTNDAPNGNTNSTTVFELRQEVNIKYINNDGYFNNLLL